VSERGSIDARASETSPKTENRRGNKRMGRDRGTSSSGMATDGEGGEKGEGGKRERGNETQNGKKAGKDEEVESMGGGDSIEGRSERVYLGVD
jgi:hypothetical protein